MEGEDRKAKMVGLEFTAALEQSSMVGKCISESTAG